MMKPFFRKFILAWLLFVTTYGSSAKASLPAKPPPADFLQIQKSGCALIIVVNGVPLEYLGGAIQSTFSSLAGFEKVGPNKVEFLIHSRPNTPTSLTVETLYGTFPSLHKRGIGLKFVKKGVQAQVSFVKNLVIRKTKKTRWAFSKVLRVDHMTLADRKLLLASVERVMDAWKMGNGKKVSEAYAMDYAGAAGESRKMMGQRFSQIFGMMAKSHAVFRESNPSSWRVQACPRGVLVYGGPGKDSFLFGYFGPAGGFPMNMECRQVLLCRTVAGWVVEK